MQVANANGDAIGFDFQWASAGTGENRTALAHIPNATVATTIDAEPEAPLETQPQRVNPKRR
jgi:hypothetical protein